MLSASLNKTFLSLSLCDVLVDGIAEAEPASVDERLELEVEDDSGEDFMFFLADCSKIEGLDIGLSPKMSFILSK